MKEFVPSGAGYLQGGLQRENWERGESETTNGHLKHMIVSLIFCILFKQL